MKRILAALVLAAAFGGSAMPAHAIDTVPLPERTVYRSYFIRTPLLLSVRMFPGILF